MWSIEKEPVQSAAVYRVLFLYQSLTGHRGCDRFRWLNQYAASMWLPCWLRSHKKCVNYRLLEGGRCLTEVKDGERKAREGAVFIRIENKSIIRNKNCPFCFGFGRAHNPRGAGFWAGVWSQTCRGPAAETLLRGYPVTSVGAGNGFPALFFLLLERRCRASCP